MNLNYIIIIREQKMVAQLYSCSDVREYKAAQRGWLVTWNVVEDRGFAASLCSGASGMRTRRTILLVQHVLQTPCAPHMGSPTKGTPTLSSANISQRLCHCISLLSTHKGVITHSTGKSGPGDVI